jgi:hypothetical protein
VAVGGGERGREREESAERRPAPFETEAGEAGEGGPVMGAMWRAGTGKKEGARVWLGTARTAGGRRRRHCRVTLECGGCERRGCGWLIGGAGRRRGPVGSG